MRKWKAGVVAMSLLLSLGGCASFNPHPLEEVGFEQRAVSKTDGGVTVSVVALSEDEASGAMGVDLARRGIQPVWIKIENRESLGYVIPSLVIDHDYFSPTEAACQVHGWQSGATSARIDQHFPICIYPFGLGPEKLFRASSLPTSIKWSSISV